MKPIEECADDNEIMSEVNKSIADGVWGSLTSKDILPYLIEGLKDPDHIKQYIREGIEPELAWQMEITRVPDRKAPYTIKSHMLLENLLYKERAKVLILESVMNGNLTPTDVFLDLREQKYGYPFQLIADVMDALYCDGVVG